ncbi:hypothetical protein CU097_007108 [Rhizopus azygosporus]|uniref:DUF7905 domain-containing protein n=1 Tax=Rhizopus azygosporus TaxID=86630 RepID=A0A367KDV3_RHIAZ|nr:hypothetical protein CU097_007108 [Rhizopus azygosporus]
MISALRSQEDRNKLVMKRRMLKIVKKMLPKLHAEIDENMMKGTYEDLEIIARTPLPSQRRATQSSTANSSVMGRPPELDKVKEKKKRQSSEPYYYNETESEDSDYHEDEYEETFTFAKNVHNPMEILTVPSTWGSKPIDYLTVIGQETDTECSYENRQVKIIGSDEDCVKEALQRFKNLQTIHKRRKRPTTTIACVHLPQDAEFAIYFCPIDRYARKDYVNVLTYKHAPYFVLLPVFKDKNGIFEKPKDRIDIPSLPYATWIPAPEKQAPTPQRFQQTEMSLDERMKMASFKNKFNAPQAGAAPDQRPLWGEKQFVHIPSAQKPPLQRSTPPPQTPPPAQKTPEEDFPALPSAPRKAPPLKSPNRRVMRVVSQKSGHDSVKGLSQLEILRQYNLHNMMTTLGQGLENVHGYKGNIKLSAYLGKILWTSLNKEQQKKIWKYQQLNDILMKEGGVKPMFNGLVTEDVDIITKFRELFPSPNGKHAYFEIHANARNQPVLPYKPVVLYMNQHAVNFTKIVTGTHRVAEIDWVSLNRKYDFQMVLQTEDLTRMDVKPYSTFLKKISISPHCRQITYEDVPDFLEVTDIYLKDTTRHRLHFPFVVEITRVEKLPLIPQTSLGYNINKILGDTGRGKVWYTIEIFYSAHDQLFKSNLDLPVGKFAPWTVEDVLGRQDDLTGPLVEFVRCLLLIIERAETAVSRENRDN